MGGNEMRAALAVAQPGSALARRKSAC